MNKAIGVGRGSVLDNYVDPGMEVDLSDNGRAHMTVKETGQLLESLGEQALDEPTELRALSALFLNESTGETLIQFYVEDEAIASQLLIAQQAAGTYLLAANDLLRELLDDARASDSR